MTGLGEGCGAQGRGESLLLPKDQRPVSVSSLSVGNTGKIYTGYTNGEVRRWEVEPGSGLHLTQVLPPQSSRPSLLWDRPERVTVWRWGTRLEQFGSSLINTSG